MEIKKNKEIAKKIICKNKVELINTAGAQDKWLRVVENLTSVECSSSYSEIFAIGEEKNVEKAIALLKNMQENNVSTEQEIKNMLSDLILSEESSSITFFFNSKKRSIIGKSQGQKNYLNMIQKKDLTICLGPAGCGKTYLAVGKGVSELIQGKVEKIVLSRPAVEAGEKLGFLPGDLKEKVDPYLQPIYDALFTFLSKEAAMKKIETGEIEIAPLAYMRGRTLKKSFIILDEAQNATKNQIKMFLTRIGENSKMVIVGDDTQVDLLNGSGLKDAFHRLKGIEEIGTIRLCSEDVQRNPLVKKILKRYDSE